MLTCDAFGVVPPISRLTPARAMAHFLLGYTGKVAGAEKGITEPQATFSSCFGAPFMALRPSTYARLLGEKIAAHKVNCWLVNTGWSGSPLGCRGGDPSKPPQLLLILEPAIPGSGFGLREDPIMRTMDEKG